MVTDERLQEHLSVGNAWSALRSLDKAETYEVVEELVRRRSTPKPFTPQQLVLILGGQFLGEDEVVHTERNKILGKYHEIKRTPVWCPGRGPEGQHDGEGAMLLPGMGYAYIESRVWWLTENGIAGWWLTEKGIA